MKAATAKKAEVQTDVQAAIKDEIQEEIRNEIREELHYEMNEVFMVECMKENLTHARHVENERMTFNSLFAALVGGSLAVISQIDDKMIAVTMIGILMMINIICYIFTKRWNSVFSNHYSLAKKIYTMLLYGEEAYDPNKKLKPADINRFYYFDNSQNKKHKTYIHTSQYFLLYNIIIFALLVCALIYFL